MSMYIVHYRDYKGNAQHREISAPTPNDVIQIVEDQNCTVIKIYEVSHVWTTKTTLEGRKP